MRIFAATIAAIMITFTIVAATSTHAQQPQSVSSEAAVRIQDLERRIDRSDAEHVVERLARLEALSETNNKLLIAVLGAVLLMLLERVVKTGQGRRPAEAE